MSIFRSTIILCVLATAALAADVDYDVEAAQVDSNLYGGGGGHAIWLPALGAGDFVFDGDGVLTVHMDGTATLTGHIVSENDSDLRFEVHLSFVDATAYDDLAANQGPKNELYDNAYVAPWGNGSLAQVDPTTWTYYTLVDGYWDNGLHGSYLKGEGDYAGANLKLQHRPADEDYLFQLGTGDGTGASNKNADPGFSGWFFFNVWKPHNYNGAYLPHGGGHIGDVNINLVDSVPEPSAILMLVFAVLGLRFRMRRR